MKLVKLLPKQFNTTVYKNIFQGSRAMESKKDYEENEELYVEKNVQQECLDNPTDEKILAPILAAVLPVGDYLIVFRKSNG